MMHTDPHDRLLDQLQLGTGTLKSLATRNAMSLRELARWADAPENAQALCSLRALADARAALVVSRSRVVAAKNLLKIASDIEKGETARKACVDLFNLRSPDAPVAAGGDSPAEPQGDALVQSLLAKLGADAARAAS